MNTMDLQRLIACLIADAPLPGLASVEVTASGTVRAAFGDNAQLFAKVAHVGPAGKVPAGPTWPKFTVEDTSPRVVNTDPDVASVRISYLASRVEHLLRAARDPRIAGVASFAAIGAVGWDWPPCGFAVKFSDDTAAFLSFNATSPDGGNDTTRPETYVPEEANRG